MKHRATEDTEKNQGKTRKHRKVQTKESANPNELRFYPKKIFVFLCVLCGSVFNLPLSLYLARRKNGLTAGAA
jgi:hypothetical protein